MSDLTTEKLRAMAATARNCDYTGAAMHMQAMAGELLRLRGSEQAAEHYHSEVGKLAVMHNEVAAARDAAQRARLIAEMELRDANAERDALRSLLAERALTADEVRAEVVSAFTRGLSIDDIAARVAEQLAGRAVVALGAEEREVLSTMRTRAFKKRSEWNGWPTADTYAKEAELLDRLIAEPPALDSGRDAEFVALRHALWRHLNENQDMSAVVGAAEAWRDCPAKGFGSHAEFDLQAAVDCFRATRAARPDGQVDATWHCPADSNECSIRRECTNKCGRKDSAAKVDPAICRRLAAECREDDERMSPVPWICEHAVLYSDSTEEGTIQLAEFTGEAMEFDDVAIARTRNNLPAIAAQLTAAAEQAERFAAVDAERHALRASCEEWDRRCAEIDRARDTAVAELASMRLPRDGAVRVAFDIGGVLSKYPAIMRALTTALVAGGTEVHVITDMHDHADVVRQIAANCFGHIPAANVHCADYAKFGEGCKAELLRKLNIDVFLDDFIGYVAAGGCPVRLLVMPDASLPYYSSEWKTAGNEQDFGRRVYKPTSGEGA